MDKFSHYLSMASIITRGPIHLQAKRLDAPALGVARRSISMNKLLKFRSRVLWRATKTIPSGAFQSPQYS
jgi:hypothetical protein